MYILLLKPLHKEEDLRSSYTYVERDFFIMFSDLTHIKLNNIGSSHERRNTSGRKGEE